MGCRMATYEGEDLLEQVSTMAVQSAEMRRLLEADVGADEWAVGWQCMKAR
jgi:hypothetical protein